MEQLRIYAFNDIYNFENMAKLKSLYDNDNFAGKKIITCSGDFIAPNMFSNVGNSSDIIKLFNKLNVDYVCFGNHEFNIDNFESVNKLIDRVDESNSKWLNSNITNECFRFNTLPFDIINISGNFKIGIFALCTGVTHNHNGEEINVLNYIDSAKKMVELLKEKKKVNYIIAMTHLHIEDDKKLARQVNGIDLILGGHDHDIHLHQVNDTYICKFGENLKYVGVITLTSYSDIATDIDLNIEFKSLKYQEYDSTFSNYFESFTKKINDYPEIKFLTKNTNMDFLYDMSNIRYEQNTIMHFLFNMLKYEYKHVYDKIDALLINSGLFRGKKYDFLSTKNINSLFGFNEKLIVTTISKDTFDKIKDNNDNNKHHCTYLQIYYEKEISEENEKNEENEENEENEKNVVICVPEYVLKNISNICKDIASINTDKNPLEFNTIMDIIYNVYITSKMNILKNAFEINEKSSINNITFKYILRESFNDEQIEYLFRLIDTDNSNSISHIEYTNFMQCVNLIEQLSKLLIHINTDLFNHLDYQQFKKLLENSETNEDNYRYLFGLFDKDNNKIISKEEFLLFLKIFGVESR